MSENEKKPNFFVRTGSRLAKFFKDTKSEAKKVVWLSKDEVGKQSSLVFLVIFVAAVVIGLIDFGFLKSLEWMASLFS